MDEVEWIRHAKEWATQILAVVDVDVQAADATFQSTLEKIRTAATEVVRQAEGAVRVGVVGGFNSGKSLLIGGLVACADLLPVGSVATTGNVTALRLRPKPDGATELKAITLEFLDRATAGECLGELLRVTEERSRNAQMPKKDCDVLLSMKNRNAAGALSVWNEVEPWVRQAWKFGEHSPDPELRNVLRELIWFVRCAQSAPGRALLDATDRTVRQHLLPLAELRASLELPVAQGQARDLTFEQLPGGPSEPRPEPLTAAFVSTAFPLIRRVEMEVAVPLWAWPALANLNGAGELVLLDFPGLGAADSGVRDFFLCQRELKQVQTILLLSMAQLVGNETGPRLFNLMRKWHQEDAAFDNRILVCVNRFDEVVLDEDEKKLNVWTGWDSAAKQFDPAASPPTVGPSEVLLGLKVLGGALGSARSLAEEDAVALVSAWWGLAQLAQGQVAEAPVGSPHWHQRLAAATWPLQARWERLAVRLRHQQHLPPATDQPSAAWLADQLQDVAADGGRSRLQHLLVHHVATHGMRQLAQDVRKAAETLREELQKLPPDRPAPTVAGRLTAAQVRQAARDLYTHYNGLLADYTRTFPELTVETASGRRDLRDHVKEKSRLLVARWSIWAAFFNELGDDGKVGNGEGLPGKSCDFQEDFTASLTESEQSFRAKLAEAVAHRLHELSQGTEPIRRRLAPVLGAEARTRVEELRSRARTKQRGEEIAARYNALRFAADPKDADFVKQFVETFLPPNQDVLDPIRTYPLPGAEALVAAEAAATAAEATGADPETAREQSLRYAASPPRIFPWDVRRGRTVLHAGSHQVLICRLKTTLENGLKEHVQALASNHLHRTLQGFLTKFREWTRNLLALSQQDRELPAALAGEQGTPQRQPAWQVRVGRAPNGL